MCIHGYIRFLHYKYQAKECMNFIADKAVVFKKFYLSVNIF